MPRDREAFALMLPNVRNFQTFIFLMLPPLFWSGNAIVGRLMVGVIPPLAFNFGRWAIAFLILLPFCYKELRTLALCWPAWPRYFLLGFLGIACYNAIQYLALVTSGPINVTLVASSTPVFMLLIGRVFYGVTVRLTALVGVFLSVAGVLIVITGGDIDVLLSLRLVVGDLLMLLASLCWSLYSWMLVRPKGRLNSAEPSPNWVAFLAVQIAFGAIASLGFALVEWWWLSETTMYKVDLGMTLLMSLLYVAVLPGIVAFRAWGVAVERVGPSFAAIVVNLTPLLTAFFSTIFLSETPDLHHALAFVFILSGIYIFQRGR